MNIIRDRCIIRALLPSFLARRTTADSSSFGGKHQRNVSTFAEGSTNSLVFMDESILLSFKGRRRLGFTISFVLVCRKASLKSFCVRGKEGAGLYNVVCIANKKTKQKPKYWSFNIL
jgi:hypothetical protein